MCTYVCSHKDNEVLKLAKDSTPKLYPKPDGELTFDVATSLYRSGMRLGAQGNNMMLSGGHLLSVGRQASGVGA